MIEGRIIIKAQACQTKREHLNAIYSIQVIGVS